MENLENYKVQEISGSSLKLISGGSWFGEAIGKLFGSAIRYNGPMGAAQVQIDMAVSFAKQ